MHAMTGSGLREISTLWRRAFREGDGVRWALVRRVRELVGIERLEQQVIAQAEELSRLAARPEVIHPVPDAPDGLRLASLEARFDTLDERLTFTEWVASAQLLRQPLVSIVLPTLGQRPASLYQALQSIHAQSYAHFEVVIVGPADLYLASPFADDARYRQVPFDERGVGKARNVGLAHCHGEFITYADDDNTMGTHWLRAVVWAFTTEVSVDVVYGARLHERLAGSPVTPPAYWLHERTWDPAVLQRFNPIDTQTLAHRAGLTEARWDEQLPSCVDWELAVRLTASGRVKPLPIQACMYSTHHDARISDHLNTVEIRSEVQRRAHIARRVRVLALSHSYPRFSEGYIESELTALQGRFDIVVASESGAQAGAETEFRVFETVERAVEVHQPEMVFVHFADVALRYRPMLERLQLPYAVRIHSYDLHQAGLYDFENDPLCIGVWAYPQNTAAIRGSHALPAIIHSAHLEPHPAGVRSGVVYASSCLPKRDWAMLRSVFSSLAGIERTAILATCWGQEAMVEPVTQSFLDADPRISIRTDVTSTEVMRAMSMATTLLYAPSSTHAVGNPRSVVEAWMSGAIPVMPDTDDARAFAGDHARYYGDANQAVELIRQLNQSGDEFDKERRANLEYATATFASPEVHDRFATELRSAFQSWEQ